MIIFRSASKAARNNFLLSSAILTERFSYWGLQATLVLFLVEIFGFSNNTALALYGTFGALCYAFSLIGGVLSDKLFGVWKSCFFGMILCICGNLILFNSNTLIYLFTGLACIVLGSGLFSPNINTFIQLINTKEKSIKETAFLIASVAGNISGASGPLIYGIFGQNDLWHYAFLFSAIINIGILSCLLINRDYFSNLELNKDKPYSYIHVLIILALILFAVFLLNSFRWINVLLLIGIIPLNILFFNLYRQLTSHEKHCVGFILILVGILLVFYIAVFQIYSSLTLFIADHVNRKFLDWTIPIPVFATLQCIFFILFAPIVNKVLNVCSSKGYNTTLITRIPVGLLIGSMGFITFACSEWIARKYGTCSALWMIMGNLFLGLGEVVLYPPIVAAITTFSPKKWAGTFMGTFGLSLAMASYFSGQIAKVINNYCILNDNKNVSILKLTYGNISVGLIFLTIITIFVFMTIKKWFYLNQNTTV